MGVVSVATMTLWKSGALLLYAVLFAYVAPWHLPVDAWWTWAVAILGVDFFFYWAHRVAHRVRLVWATHQAHHSSEYFNFATALRQKWNNSAEIVAWLPLPLLGVPPALVFLGFSISLVYQFFVHTERVDRLFGSFQPELHRPTYGLTTRVGTHRIVRLQTHEYASIVRDVRRTPRLRDKLGYVFGPPGWQPDTASADTCPV